MVPALPGGGRDSTVFDAADFEPVIKTAEGRAVMEAEAEFRKRTNT